MTIDTNDIKAMLDDLEERGYQVVLYHHDAPYLKRRIWRIGVHKERDDPCAYEDGEDALGAVRNGYFAIVENETLGAGSYKLDAAIRRLVEALAK